MLKIQDHIYGEFTITSPIILDLLNSQPLQRLKKLNQLGIPDAYYHLKNFSRYEHSLGVMLLVKHLGASLEEQVAALLHDVSHRAFSHVYDWVVGASTTEDSQDQSHVDFLNHSSLAPILQRHRLNITRISDFRNFSLLERPVPDLCADRIDYSLRQFTPDLSAGIFAGLTVKAGFIVCKNLEIASKFARAFLNCQVNYWGGYEGQARYHLFSTALKIALNSNLIAPTDFWLEDDYLVTKLLHSHNQKILKILTFLRRHPLPFTKNGPVVYEKFRYIDPLFTKGNQLKRLSDADSDFRQLLQTAKAQNRQGITVPSLEFVLTS